MRNVFEFGVDLEFFCIFLIDSRLSFELLLFCKKILKNRGDIVTIFILVSYNDSSVFLNLKI